MKKLFIGILFALALLFAPVCVSAAPIMFSMCGGAGFSVGIKHKAELDKLRQNVDNFVISLGCEPTKRDEIVGKFNNYTADHPMGQGRPSAEWLQGVGKAVGADYVTLYYPEISGIQSGNFFHTSARMNISTDMRIVNTANGETIFTCVAPEIEGKRDKVLDSADALITKAEADIKKQGIKF